MKVLVNNLITEVIASSEDSGRPAINLLDNHPKKIAKAAAGETVSYTFEVSGAADWFGLVNTNASRVVVKVYPVPSAQIGDENDASHVAPIFENEYSLSGIDTYGELIVGQGQSLYVLDVNYPYQVSAHSIIVELDTMNDGLVPYCGLAVAGVGLDSKYQIGVLSEGMYDYSSYGQLSNGADWALERDRVRRFSGVLSVERDREFYDWMHGVYRVIGRTARLWRVTDLQNHDWVVFAKIESDLMGEHGGLDLSTIPITLLEVL